MFISNCFLLWLTYLQFFAEFKFTYCYRKIERNSRKSDKHKRTFLLWNKSNDSIKKSFLFSNWSYEIVN